MFCKYAVLITPFQLLLLCSPTNALTIETVPIGNPGNAPDTEVMTDGTTGYGAVDYSYRMGKFEITNAQYVDFLNAVAASDPYELYRMATGEDQRDGIVRSGSPGSYTYSVKPDAIGEGPGGSDYTFSDKPVNHVSLFDAFRFANWMHNGQGNGDTETGAYTLLGGTSLPSNYMTVTRNPNAIWFLPNEDEWYKAAFYDPSTGQYHDYANGTDVAPNNNLPSSDTGNSANYRVGPQTIDSSYTTGNYDYPHTDIGAYELSTSPYGTFDQMGNVFERTETIAFSAFYRIGRGGAFNTDLSRLSANHRSSGQGVGEEDGSRGFRIARSAIVPEPTSFTLAALGLLSLAWRPRLRRWQLGSNG